MNSSTGRRRRRGRSGRRTWAQTEIVHPDAAGIDVGSKEHYVAVAPDRDGQPVRTFGCTTCDLHAMATWLVSCGIATVALESTGVYWIPVAEVLEARGLAVCLVDARHVRQVPGRKTDVLDCQWIQKLHTFGLLRAAFRPQRRIRELRGYWRHRASLVADGARQIHRMQKALEEMNVQLHKVLSDISGVTGLAIIRAIVAGERDPAALARLRVGAVKSRPEEIEKALTGEYRPEHVFQLSQCLQLYDCYQEMIRDVDAQLESALARFESRTSQAKAPDPRRGKRRKNQPHFDLARELHRVTGVDLTRIDGIDALTAQTLIAESGIDMTAFPNEKHYASWLGLCPNHQITGGRVRKRRTRRVQNRAAQALRVAAQSLARSRTALGAYYRRMRAHHGPAKAITATAHKLARLVYRMLRYGMEYVDRGQQDYQRQYEQRRLHMLRKQAATMGYDLVDTHTAELVS